MSNVDQINQDDGRCRIDDIGTEVELTKEKLISVQADDPLTSVGSSVSF